MRKLSCLALATLLSAAACSEPKVAAKPVGDSAKHDAMTAEQHSAMHGNQSPGLDDSSFAKLQARGAAVMGVDQYKSAHKFDITSYGGRIKFQMSGDDTSDVAAIRAHMKYIQKAFLAGDFAKPFAVHGREMPGTAVMKRMKSGIRYIYADLGRGAELLLVTDDAEARAAIAEFMKAQRVEHRSGGTDPPSR